MRFHVTVDPAALPRIAPDLQWPNSTVLRGDRRGDWQQPPQGSAAHEALETTWSLVWPRFARRMRTLERQSSALCYVEPGEPAQTFHCDADGDRRYHTIMVPLTTEIDSGGTEFEDGVAYTAVRGLAYCFDGAIVHRGAAHRGSTRRVYAAYVVRPAGAAADPNVFSDH
jgi:hypothetical protein